ncbi:hypothetical protein N7468_001946 [Penicillium chermesinum]|uniref:Zn(2)-C6 fungal-type domain-containing protein n=1 Tax=Penicillium chermesinum TaxID=63820 RepID=A0A9W9PHL2_9EURO|nr:uncharacterized protein N7468_001946 [Penicillium chermesinum]KAJ5246963.1 hypothetical protein N7468_001946 [Penicillium chermesinum]
MRACNGCRKRKIKCDAATTNTWPCSACTRLKLVCVPPTIGQEGDFGPDPQGLESTNASESSSAPDTSHHPFPVPPTYRDGSQSSMGTLPAYDGMNMYPQFVPAPPNQPSIYNDMRTPPMMMQHPSYQPPPLYHGAQPPSIASPDQGLYMDDPSTVENLSEVLGELKIDETGIAPYIRRQRTDRLEPDAPVQDEAEERLPPLSTGAGAKIRIPPELMPAEEDVMHYFKIYFDEIHPICPLYHAPICTTNGKMIATPYLLFSSKLFLHALVDCLMNPQKEHNGLLWLILENLYLKKGYYYRSWQTVKTIVSMAKDLDLHEHYSSHAEGRPCDLSPIECLVHTRVWQTLLVVEVMIGAPQGRSDYGVDPETVDMRPTLDIRGLDAYETDRSRQYAYFVRNAHHIRIITDLYHKVKKQKDWEADPRFVQKNPLFEDWLRSLPSDLQVNYPPDGSPPWIPSHFVAITSPDPDFNSDAREYFTRHMRILERCSAAWPMPEIQAQIDSLRLAFSADTNRPFELKPSFPYGTPSEGYQPSPPMDAHYHPHLRQMSNHVQSRVGLNAHPITPPISAGAEDSKSDTSSQLQSLGMVPHQPSTSHPLDQPLTDENSWDPSRIINQWDMAFSVNPASVSTNSPPLPINNPAQPMSNIVNHQYPVPYDSNKVAVSQTQSVSPPQFQAPPVVFTARDWQQSVASVYDPHGLKRRWNYSVDLGAEDAVKRQRG